jgi:hypothetical protein
MENAHTENLIVVGAAEEDEINGKENEAIANESGDDSSNLSLRNAPISV